MEQVNPQENETGLGKPIPMAGVCAERCCCSLMSLLTRSWPIAAGQGGRGRDPPAPLSSQGSRHCSAPVFGGLFTAGTFLLDFVKLNV